MFGDAINSYQFTFNGFHHLDSSITLIRLYKLLKSSYLRWKASLKIVIDNTEACIRLNFLPGRLTSGPSRQSGGG
jgi:hypothetical protein